MPTQKKINKDLTLVKPSSFLFHKTLEGIKGSKQYEFFVMPFKKNASSQETGELNVKNLITMDCSILG